MKIPSFLAERFYSWLPCRVAGDFAPEGMAIDVELYGRLHTLIAPYHTLRKTAGQSELRVTVVAELPDEEFLLAEFPRPPIVTSQRFRLHPDDVRP